MTIKPEPSSHEAGTWFAIPLPSGGWALGLVARRRIGTGRKGRRIFCYFFGPRVSEPGDFGWPIKGLPNDRVLFARTGDEALMRGRWVVIGKDADFSKANWPMPKFKRGPGMGGGPDWKKRAILVRYDDDLENAYDEEVVIIEDESKYPDDADVGYLAMEDAIDRAMQERS